MKKLLSFLIPMLAICSLTFGQRNISLDFDVVSPANNAILKVGESFNMTVVVTNTGPDAIMPGDTVAYRDPTGPAVQTNFYVLTTTASKAVNDTFIINKQLTYNSLATLGPRNFCVYGLVANGSQVNFDTTGWIDCNPVTLQGWPTGIDEVVETKKGKSIKLDIYPNPATSDFIKLGYVAQNTAAVEVSIFDLTGRKVLTQSLGKAFKGQEGYGVDISSLNNGMYILELRQDGIKATGQFVK